VAFRSVQTTSVDSSYQTWSDSFEVPLLNPAASFQLAQRVSGRILVYFLSPSK